MKLLVIDYITIYGIIIKPQHSHDNIKIILYIFQLISYSSSPILLENYWQNSPELTTWRWLYSEFHPIPTHPPYLIGISLIF